MRTILLADLLLTLAFNSFLCSCHLILLWSLDSYLHCFIPFLGLDFRLLARSYWLTPSRDSDCRPAHPRPKFVRLHQSTSTADLHYASALAGASSCSCVLKLARDAAPLTDRLSSVEYSPRFLLKLSTISII